jgi:type IV pilus assembly protein PilO
MINIADLKSLNPKTPGAWPWPVKIIVFVLIFVAVVAAGAVFFWQEQWDTLNKAKEDEGQLKETFLVKKKQAINLDLIKKQLPNKSEMDALLTDINQAGLGRGLQFELFRPGAEKAIGSFTEQPIVIKVTGNYDDLGKFAGDIAMLPRIVTLNDISINPSNNTLAMDAIAKTFRYLDESELAAQKVKPAAGKPAGKPAAPASSGGHGG